MTVLRTGSNDDLMPDDQIVDSAVEQEISDALKLHNGEDLFDTSLWVDWYGLKFSKASPALFAEAVRRAVAAVPSVASVQVVSAASAGDRTITISLSVRVVSGATLQAAAVVSGGSDSTPSLARLYWINA